MSLMRTLSAWTLRALLAWGAVEASASLYDYANQRSADLSAIAGQGVVAHRLEARARAAEANASALDHRLGGLVRVSWTPVAPDNARAAADAMRQQLIDLGAQAPVVDATLAPAGEHMVRMVFTARWREPAETSPSALHALAARSPELSVSRLAMSRAGGLIATEAQFEAIAPSLEQARTR